MTTDRDKDAAVARAVLIADRLLTDPAMTPMLERLQALVPGHVRDQMGAAVAETDRIIDRWVETGGGHEQGRPAGSYPEFVRLGLLTTVAEWIHGSGRTCVHSPAPFRPEPVFAVAWKPGLVVCVRCPHLLAPSRAESVVCDGCGRAVGGVDAGDPMWPAVVQVGPLSYETGVCSGCRFWDEP